MANKATSVSAFHVYINPKISREDAKTPSYLKLSLTISFASFAALREKKILSAGS
jgi:hypothetical protein